VLVLSVLVLAFGRFTVMKDRIRIHNLVNRVDVGDKESLGAFREELRSAMRRHPGEPYFSRIGGLVAWYAHDQSPVPWMARSLERGMTIGRTHFDIARILARAGAGEQALLELRLAVTYQPELGGQASSLIAGMTRNFDQVSRAVPDGKLGARVFLGVASHLDDRWADLRERCLYAAIDREPDSVAAHTALARSWMSHLVEHDGRCVGDRVVECEHQIMAEVMQLAKLSPESPIALMTKADLLVALGRPVDADRLLREGCPRYMYEDYARCIRSRVRAAGATGSAELLAAASKDVMNAGCGSGHGCADLYMLLGGQAERMQDWGDALSYYQRAAAEETSDASWTGIARVAKILGEHALAASALGHLSKGNPGDMMVRKELDEETQRAMTRALTR